MWADFYLAVAAFVVISVFSWAAVKRLIVILIKAKQLDQPNERSMHSAAVPRGGGIVISLAMILALFVAAVFSSQPLFYSVFAILMGAWTVLSWWDDRSDLSAAIRIAPQFLFGIATIAAYGWVNRLAGFDIGHWGAIATLVGVVWMANLYNFMDGIDGLAASQAVVAALTFTAWFYFLASPILSLVCLVVAASSYGFLLNNWQPARIFMGDVGSVTLGAFFATCMILAATRHQVPILSLMLIFGVFILDTSVTVMLRIRRREPFWKSHRQHLYQRLVQSGFSHQMVTTGAILMMLMCSLMATLSLTHHAMISFFIIIEIAAYTAFYVLCRHREKLIIK